MSVNYILIWMVGVSAATMIVRMARSSARSYRGWIGVNAALLAWLGAGLLWFPEFVGYAAGAAWLAFVLAPMLGTRVVWRWTAQQRYEAAWRLAEVLCCLHPFDAEWHRPKLLRAMRLAQRGENEAALKILRRLVACGGVAGRAAAVQMYRMTGRWAELVEWINGSVTMTALLRDAGTLLAFVRALGETGDLERMQWVCAQYGGVLNRAVHRPSRELCRLTALAFCGQTAAVERLLSESLDWLPVTTQEFWRATAEAAAGETEKSHRRLTRLLDWETDAVSRATIERRLTVPLAIGTGTTIDYDFDETTAPRVGFGWQTARMTQVLVAINVAMFTLEVLMGGSENEAVLFRLGALSAEAVASGDWWRLLAAMFLHAGWLHLAMNMTGLLLLGPFVETSLGRVKFVATYLVSGLASMAFVVALTHWRLMQNDLLVGASGSIMGLIGATAIVLLRNWRAGRSPVALQRLQRVALAIGLQVVFDFVTPQVSMAAHTSGVVAGGIVALLLTLEDRGT